jgi:hypothetical protein
LPLVFYNTKSNELGLNTSLLGSSTMNIAKGGANLDSMWNDGTGYGILWRGKQERKMDIGSRYALNKKCMGASPSGNAHRDSVQVKL